MDSHGMVSARCSCTNCNQCALPESSWTKPCCPGPLGRQAARWESLEPQMTPSVPAALALPAMLPGLQPWTALTAVNT